MALNRFGMALAATLLVMGCVDNVDAPEEVVEEQVPVDDLPVGDVLNPPADGNWGSATTCKEIPVVEPLANPKIVVSLDGLTLRLYDEGGTYDRVFPVGVGAIEDGKSMTPVSTQFPAGTFYTRTDERPTFDGPTPAQAKWGWNQACRMWWTGEDGKKVPVFAGLPFIRLAGHPTSASYALHGPIDDYTIPRGGNLRRGYVSHGCVRMASADILEVYGRIQGKQAEVLVQKPVERREDGTAVDLDPWMMSECQSDADCGFEGGVCRQNEYSGVGYCTKACTKYCPDKAGHPATFCAEDAESGGGFCAVKSELVRNNACDRYAGFVRQDGVSRPDGSATASVCVPGSKGWIGDRCLSDDECDTGLCTPVEGGPVGICTETCTRYCPDKANAAGTFCVEAPETVPDAGGICVAKCYNDDHCPAGTVCETASRINQTSVTASVCVPE